MLLAEYDTAPTVVHKAFLPSIHSGVQGRIWQKINWVSQLHPQQPTKFSSITYIVLLDPLSTAPGKTGLFEVQ